MAGAGDGQPPGLWRRRWMGQPLVGDSDRTNRVPQEVNQSLRFLPAALAEGLCDGPLVAVVRSRDELCRLVTSCYCVTSGDLTQPRRLHP
jgi:hypothetical protein